MVAPAAVGGVASAHPVATDWIVFRYDGLDFGMPLTRVREILAPRRLTRLPGCGPAVGGLLGVRGRVVTAFDFGAALGLRPLEPAAGPLLLVEDGERLVAFAVREVRGLARTPARGLPVPAPFLRALDVERADVLGIGALGEEPFVAVDPDRILARLFP